MDALLRRLPHQHLVRQVDKQAVFHHARNGIELTLQFRAITNAPREAHIQNQISLIGHHRTGLPLGNPQFTFGPHGPKTATHKGPGARKHLHRQEKVQIQPVHQLAGIHHHQEAARRRGHQLFLNMASATAFDQLEARVHFISAVNGQINSLHVVEIHQGNGQPAGQNLTLKGGRHRCDVLQLALAQFLPQSFNHEGGCGSRSQAQHHSAPDLLHCCLCHGLFDAGLQVAHAPYTEGKILAGH